MVCPLTSACPCAHTTHKTKKQANQWRKNEICSKSDDWSNQWKNLQCLCMIYSLWSSRWRRWLCLAEPRPAGLHTWVSTSSLGSSWCKSCTHPLCNITMDLREHTCHNFTITSLCPPQAGHPHPRALQIWYKISWYVFRNRYATLT